MRRLRISTSHFRLPLLCIALSGFVWCTIAYMSTGYLLPNLVRIVCFVVSAALLIALLVVVGYTLAKLIQKSHKNYLHFSALVWFLLAVLGVVTVAAVSVGFWYGLAIRALLPASPDNNWLVHGGPGGTVYLLVVIVTAIGLAIGRSDQKLRPVTGATADKTVAHDNVPVA